MNLQYLALPAIQHASSLPDRLPAHDIVTSCWERELLQFIAKRFLPAPAAFRCLSIGDSQDELYTTLQGIKKADSRLEDVPAYHIEPQDWELFMALNLSSEEVESLNGKYNTEKKVRFFRHDYRQGLGLFRYEQPFQWYWLGIEATQTCSQASLTRLLEECIAHAQHNSIIALDFVGKHNIAQIEELNGWDRDMFEAFLAKAGKPEGTRVRILRCIDRSIFLHEPLRQTILSLFTPSKRTDLSKLILAPIELPANAPEEIQEFFETFQYCWNALVRYTSERFAGNTTPPEDWEEWVEIPTPLKYSLKSTEQLVRDTEWIAYGDVRANILEPHLAYALRHLEYEIQRGLGAGQYFTVFLEVQKS